GRVPDDRRAPRLGGGGGGGRCCGVTGGVPSKAQPARHAQRALAAAGGGEVAYHRAMFSYRHGFHAGNHADVLKHLVLVQVLAHMRLKDKPFWYVDTHAGAARYDLGHPATARHAEYRTGIARLWDRTQLPAAVEAYVAEVRRLNPDGRLRHYPGSPQIALQVLRPTDRLRLFEKHTTEFRVLQRQVEGEGRRVLAQAADGFEAIEGVLPPPPRRGMVLIDPSYEDKDDYRRARRALAEGLRRFA